MGLQRWACGGDVGNPFIHLEFLDPGLGRARSHIWLSCKAVSEWRPAGWEQAWQPASGHGEVGWEQAGATSCFFLFFFFYVLFFTPGRPSGLVHLVLSLLVYVCLLPPYRLPDQCDGCPGPAAVPHPPEHRDALEGQARGLQTGQQRPAPSPRHHGGRHAECGLLTPMPPAGKRVRATGVSRMDLL